MAKNEHAVELGRLGGQAGKGKSTPKKARASKRNLQKAAKVSAKKRRGKKLGGDPRKPKVGIMTREGGPDGTTREVPFTEFSDSFETRPILCSTEEVSIEELKRRYPVITGEDAKRFEQAVLKRMEPKHDPKACRIYRCLQCKALGHKDRNRGLL